MAILGAGLVGAGVAGEYLAGGHRVTITTSSPERAQAALARVRARAETGTLGWAASPGDAAAGAQLVVECLPEDLALKRNVLRAAQAANPAAILATNTSSFAVGEIAAALEDPSRLLATHYLNPPELFPLVEVVPHAGTAPECVAEVEAVLARLGKRPVRLDGDAPGFVVNRLQFALLREACHIVASGIADAATVDRLVSEALARRWAGVGPFASAALGGRELFEQVAARLFPELSTATQADLERHTADAIDRDALARRRAAVVAAAATAFDAAEKRSLSAEQG